MDRIHVSVGGLDICDAVAAILVDELLGDLVDELEILVANC